MKRRYLIGLLFVLSISSCGESSSIIENRLYYFDTSINTKLFEGEKAYLQDIEQIYKSLDEFSDNYHQRTGENVLSINSTPKALSPDFYNLLKKASDVSEQGAYYYNPLCGSLAKLWKNALFKKSLPTEEEINAELVKVYNSSLLFNNDFLVCKSGDAEIDLGGIVKGYALDNVKSYLSSKNVTKYLINAGFSSLLLGEKNSKDGLFTVKISDLNDSYLKLKNCFISTSSISEQGVQLVEGGPIYSHIINPVTGSAINENDAVIVISDKGYLGDALSTSMMMNTIEQIKEIETAQNVQTIVIKNHQIIYKNEGIEIYHG